MNTKPTIGLECDGVFRIVDFGNFRSGGFGLAWPACDTEDDTVAVLVGVDRDDVTAQAKSLGWWIESAEVADQRAQCPACRAAGPAPDRTEGGA